MISLKGPLKQEHKLKKFKCFCESLSRDLSDEEEEEEVDGFCQTKAHAKRDVNIG